MSAYCGQPPGGLQKLHRCALIGPAGTWPPRRRRRAIRLAVPPRQSPLQSRASTSARCATRPAFVAKRSSSSRSRSVEQRRGVCETRRHLQGPGRPAHHASGIPHRRLPGHARCPCVVDSDRSRRKLMAWLASSPTEQSSRLMSIHCPLPVRCRINSAACTAFAAQRPQDRSLIENAHLHRIAVGLSSQRHESAHGLNDEIVTGFVAAGAVLTEARYRAIDRKQDWPSLDAA